MPKTHLIKGMSLTGWPTTVVSRGRVIVDNNELLVYRGAGEFLPRGISEFAHPRGVAVREMEPTLNLGAELLDR